MNIAEHFEQNLGTIAEGWSVTPPNLSGIQVVRFGNQPEPEVSTYASLGLSRHILTLDHGQTVRQELLLAARDGGDQEAIARLVGSIAEGVASSHRAVLRGEVIGPGMPLPADWPIEAVYAAIPVVYPEPLASLSTTVPPTIVVWLVAIRGDEAAYVQRNGWSAFEARLDRANPDLFDIGRSTLL